MEQYINNAVLHFEQLLREQIARQQKMEKDSGAIDYSSLDKIIIGDRTRENGEIKQKITIQYKFVGAL